MGSDAFVIAKIERQNIKVDKEHLNKFGMYNFPRPIVYNPKEKRMKHKGLKEKDVIQISNLLEIELKSNQKDSKQSINCANVMISSLILNKISFHNWNLFTKDSYQDINSLLKKNSSLNYKSFYFKESEVQNKSNSSTLQKSIKISSSRKTNQSLLFKVKLLTLLIDNIDNTKAIKFAFDKITTIQKNKKKPILLKPLFSDVVNTNDSNLSLSLDISSEMDTCDYRGRNNIHRPKGFLMIPFRKGK